MGTMRTFGPHKAWFEAPDTLRVVVVGAFDMKLKGEVEALAHELQALHPTLYLISDMRQSTGLTPEVRKAFGENPDPSPCAGMVVFGASFAVRSMANMMTQASAQLGHPGTSPFIIVDTEEEAKAWVAVERSRRVRPPEAGLLSLA